MFFEQVSPFLIISLVPLSLLLVVWNLITTEQTVPVLRKRFRFVPKALQKVEALFSAQRLLEDGYIRHSNNSNPFLLSSFNGPDVMIPFSEMKQTLGRRENVFDSESAHFDMLESDYTLLNPRVRKPVHEDVIRGPFTRRLGCFTSIMMDEITHSMDHLLDADQREVEIKVYDAMAEVIACTANRVFVGQTLSRNADYHANAKRFAMDVVTGSSILKIFPAWLKPDSLVGKIVCLPNAYHYRKCAKYLVPLILARLDGTNGNDLEDEKLSDYLELHIHHVRELIDTAECTAEMISLRLMLLNFASIYPTAGVLTNVLLDLAGSNPDAGYWEGLRDEIETVQEECGNSWTEQSLARLWRLDSALKETTRKWSVLSYAVPRKIASPEGLKLKNGAILSQGTTVGIPMYSIHHDESLYADPYVYNPFRFFDLREHAGNDKVQQPHLALTTSSSATYFAWGSGKHACPGRFMASTMMKLVMIYLVTNYDIVPTKTRQKNSWFGSLILPPGRATVRLKKRAQS